MKMQRSTIKEYNEDYDAGIHNVIAFLFSQNLIDYRGYTKINTV